MRRIWMTALSFLLMLLLLSALPVSTLAAGEAPVAENLDLKTYCNVSVGGKLSAFDPDGEIRGYAITTAPVKGDIELKSDGSFIYTPREDRRGRDYFGYKATDAQGNSSQEATVIIKIDRQKKGVRYADMTGRTDEYAALALSELGLFTGAQIGGVYCFEPEHAVTRGEFLSMCMRLAEKPVYAAVYKTGYADDAEIPLWLKGYASSAAAADLYRGLETAEGVVFGAGEPITGAQAAELLNRALGLSDVRDVPAYDMLDGQQAQACANLSACGILSGSSPAQALLSRAEAAQMLVAAKELLERR